MESKYTTIEPRSDRHVDKFSRSGPVLWRSESLKCFPHVHLEDWPSGPYHMDPALDDRICAAFIREISKPCESRACGGNGQARRDALLDDRAGHKHNCVPVVLSFGSRRVG